MSATSPKIGPALVLALVCIGVALAGAPARARAKDPLELKIGNDISLKLGLWLQALFVSTLTNTDHDPELERDNFVRIRRARARFFVKVTKWVTAFVQTEAAAASGPGLEMTIIDAWVQLDAHRALMFRFGEHLAPSSRQDVTSPASLLSLDRPSIAYKALSWGTRAVYAFANKTFTDADVKLRGETGVRDLGGTLWGNHSFSDWLHVKYFAGMYKGVQAAESLRPRVTLRVQLNFGDAEDRYVNRSTYLGTKRTFGVGFSFDYQKVDVTRDTGDAVDYLQVSADLFVEHELGPGVLNLEGCFTALDFGDAGQVATTGQLATQSQGRGFAAQVGYYLWRLQPWAVFERWFSDGPGGLGGYWAARAGLTFYIKGHNANIKAGYERFQSDSPISGSSTTAVDTFVAGIFMAI